MRFKLCIMLYSIVLSCLHLSAKDEILQLYNTGHVNSVFSSYLNPAGPCFSKKPFVLLSQECSFMLPELSTYEVAGSLPSSFGNFNIYMKYFGSKKYNSSIYGIGYGKSMGEKFSAGVRFLYGFTNVPLNNNFSSFIACHAGFIANPHKSFFFGAYLNKSVRMNEKSTDINDLIKYSASAGYYVMKNIFIHASAEKEMPHKAIIKTGVEYALLKNFFLRTVVTSNPSTYMFGMGFVWKKTRTDINVSNHRILGLSPQVLVSCKL